MRLEDEIKSIIIDRAELDLSIDQIGDNDFLLTGGLNLESLVLIQIVADIEDKYEFQFDDEDITIDLFNSVNSIASCVKSKCGN